jgi:hypothetical protein
MDNAMKLKPKKRKGQLSPLESRDGNRRTGRRSKLTEEVGNIILNAIAIGAGHSTACQAAGIGKSTLYSWLQRGEAQEMGLFRDLLDAVRHIEAKRECEALAHIAQAAEDDWRAAAWFLARRYPERWGRTTTRLGRTEMKVIASPISLTKEELAVAQALATDLERFSAVADQ